MFTDTSDVNDLADTVYKYINFCVESIVPNKTVEIYPNNKPWVTKHIKDILNRKKKAFVKKDRDKLREIKKELKREIR